MCNVQFFFSQCCELNCCLIALMAQLYFLHFWPCLLWVNYFHDMQVSDLINCGVYVFTPGIFTAIEGVSTHREDRGWYLFVTAQFSQFWFAVLISSTTINVHHYNVCISWSSFLYIVSTLKAYIVSSAESSFFSLGQGSTTSQFNFHHFLSLPLTIIGYTSLDTDIGPLI